jgi:hypothetical protein
MVTDTMAKYSVSTDASRQYGIIALENEDKSPVIPLQPIHHIISTYINRFNCEYYAPADNIKHTSLAIDNSIPMYPIALRMHQILVKSPVELDLKTLSDFFSEFPVVMIHVNSRYVLRIRGVFYDLESRTVDLPSCILCEIAPFQFGPLGTLIELHPMQIAMALSKGCTKFEHLTEFLTHYKTSNHFPFSCRAIITNRP